MPSSLIDRFSEYIIRSAGDRIAEGMGGRGNFCILNYHRILDRKDPLLDSEPDVSTFRWHMKALAENFNVLSLSDALEMLENGHLPPRAVCVTFDDGYRSIHDLALPVLVEYKIPATIFVSTGYLDGENMWNDRIIEAARILPEGPLDLSEIGLGIYTVPSLNRRKNMIDFLIDSAKYLPTDTRLNLPAKLENFNGNVQTAHLMLTREMVIALSKRGVEIGGHTVSHPILTSLTNDESKYEITQCKVELEKLIGKPVTLFAYPNGKKDVDFDERHAKMVSEAGYVAAFTTAIGAVNATNDNFHLPRSRPWDSTPMFFKLRLLRWLAK
ncbi:MAG: polysaccharide deacetylase family protein [bacterium]|nr:polysaccharide deacetylase family protein [bacterium]